MEMRILLVFTVNASNLRTDTNTYDNIDMIRGMLKLRKDLWFYIVVPRGVEGKEIYEELPHVTVIEADKKIYPYFEEIGIEDMATIKELFSMRHGIYPIDIVMTDKTALALHIMKTLGDYKYTREAPYYHIPVLIYEDRVFARTETHQIIDWMEFMLRSTSYAAADATIVATSFERRELLEIAKDYVSPYWYKELKKKVHVIPRGIDCDNVDQIIRDVEKRRNFTVFWGGRFTAEKRPFFVIEQMLKMYEGGRDIDMIVTMPGEGTFKFADKISEVKKRCRKLVIKTNVKREEFLRLCASSHVWISASLHEGFSIGHAEMAYTGVPGIVPRRPWSIEIFGEDYPLMYDANKFEEAATLLRWVYENYEEALEIARQTRERIKKLFDKKLFAKRVLELMEKIVVENEKHKLALTDKSEFGKTVLEILEMFEIEGKEEFTIYEVVQKLKQLGEKLKFRIGANTPSMPTLYDVHKFIIRHGYIDTCEKPYPVYRRKKQ